MSSTVGFGWAKGPKVCSQLSPREKKHWYFVGILAVKGHFHSVPSDGYFYFLCTSDPGPSHSSYLWPGPRYSFHRALPQQEPAHFFLNRYRNYEKYDMFNNYIFLPRSSQIRPQVVNKECSQSVVLKLFGLQTLHGGNSDFADWPAGSSWRRFLTVWTNRVMASSLFKT